MAARDRLIRDAQGITQSRVFREALGLSTRGVLEAARGRSASHLLAEQIAQHLAATKPLSLADQFARGIGAAEHMNREVGLRSADIGRMIAGSGVLDHLTKPQWQSVIEQAQTAQDFWRKSALGIEGVSRVYEESLRPLSGLMKEFQRQQDALAGAFTRIDAQQLQAIRSATETAWRMSSFLDESEWEELDEETPSQLVTVLIMLFNGFVTNSKEQFEKFGIFQLIALIGLLNMIQTNMAGPAYTDADRQQNAAVAEQVERMEKSLEGALALKVGETEYLESLDRAEAKGKARIRATPSRDASIIAKIDEGTTIAIVETKGRWAKIIFVDPLSMRARDGWIWRGSIDPLNAEEQATD